MATWGMTRTNQQAEDGEGAEHDPETLLRFTHKRDFIGFTHKRLRLDHLSHFQELWAMERLVWWGRCLVVLTRPWGDLL